MAECSIQPLLDDAACLAVLKPFELELVITQLLCEIWQSGQFEPE